MKTPNSIIVQATESKDKQSVYFSLYLDGCEVTHEEHKKTSIKVDAIAESIWLHYAHDFGLNPANCPKIEVRKAGSYDFVDNV